MLATAQVQSTFHKQPMAEPDQVAMVMYSNLSSMGRSLSRSYGQRSKTCPQRENRLFLSPDVSESRILV